MSKAIISLNDSAFFILFPLYSGIISTDVNTDVYPKMITVLVQNHSKFVQMLSHTYTIEERKSHESLMQTFFSFFSG